VPREWVLAGAWWLGIGGTQQIAGAAAAVVLA